MNYIDEALSVVGKEKATAKVYQISEGRRRSLESIADAIILTARDEACRIGHFDHTPEVTAIEGEIHETYTQLLQGKAKIIDYRSAVDRWLRVGTTGKK